MLEELAGGDAVSKKLSWLTRLMGCVADADDKNRTGTWEHEVLIYITLNDHVNAT